MRELPAGTVTLLFSDIEGSTALLGRVGDRYGDALSAQRALMRAAISASGGLEVGTEGDSFFVAFESAGAAVGCCVAAQRALAAHRWPEGGVVRVRMGLHSGEPSRHEDGYVGMDVHRAARIAAAAHGGQVVLSEATRLLVGSRLPAGLSVRDLGWHRLKDIDAPERIYQLVAPGLAERFPPLKGLGAPTNLPAPLTPLVGRDTEAEQLRAMVAEAGVRLVTLTGSGGVGKTRLALAAAASLDQVFEHGVFFVALAAVRDAEVMWKTIADSLNISGDGSADSTVTGYLRDRRVLLVLDNLEQLGGAGQVVAGLLAAAPAVVVMATSRRPLHLVGEQELPVPPLEVPGEAGAAGVAEVAACDAARLFAQQAAMVRSGFTLTEGNAADVAAICRRLDGLPLAIELAASRVKLLTPGAVLARLGDSLSLAAGDVGRPSRQQTLRSTIAWSCELLDPDLAEAFRRIAVFAGGCDLDALAAVAGPADSPGGAAAALQLAADLLDVSLITVTEGADGEPRLGMLETIRQYALERLKQADDLDDTRRRHAEFYAGFAELTAAQLRGPAHLASLNRLEAEHDNLRAALAWSLDKRAADVPGDAGRTAIGLRLAEALGLFWYQHGHATEGRRWLEQAVELAPDQAGAPLAKIVHRLGMLLRQQGELDGALRLLERSLAIWRELGNRTQEALELNSLGIAYRHLGDLNTARSLFEQSIAIARELGGKPRVSVRLANLGNLEVEAGNLDRATQVLQEALALYQAEGDPVSVANAQEALAMASLRSGRPREARDLISRTFDYVVTSGEPELLAIVLESSACIAAELGDSLRGARLAGAAECVRKTVGMPIPQPDAEVLEQFLSSARARVTPKAWDAEVAAGRSLSREQAAALLISPTPRTG